MTGNILNQMLRQEGNFCDPAASAQYRLAKIPTLQISSAKQINVYKYLSNIVVNSTAPDEKPLLSPGAYIATVINDVDGKITVTVDASGIYVKSNAPVKIEEDIELEIRIKLLRDEGDEGVEQGKGRVEDLLQDALCRPAPCLALVPQIGRAHV